MQWRAAGESIALVPTMGNLHAGHISLMQMAKQHATHIVASIFVNPLQFGPTEDFARYPRTETADSEKLTAAGVEALFLPSVDELLPHGLTDTTFVEVPALSYQLCGQFRPGHFRGVTTIVSKLLNCVQPNVVIFGEKDWQQLCCIRTMIQDLHLPTELLGGTTIRETDGLALSSRNQYLSATDRARAPLLYQVLQQIKSCLKAGDRCYHDLTATADATLKSSGFEPQYISICQAETLLPADTADHDLVILAAAYLGTTRLIDNIHCIL
jgi:pantoate--beta-alanine ligase